MKMTLLRNPAPLVVLVACVALAVSNAGAQTSSKAVVTVEATGPAAPVAAGETFTAMIKLGIKSGFHINAQKPSEDYLIGTSATLTPPRGFSVVRSTYPKARMGRFSFSETPLAVYDGNAQITVTLKADASVAAGTSTIPGKVEFQACNDDQCLPPSTVDVSFTVDVTDAGQDAAGAKQTLTITSMPPDARIFVDGKAAGTANAQGRAVLRDIVTGTRRVRVEATGYTPFEKEIEVNAETPAMLAAPLVPDPNANSNLMATTNTTSVQPVPAIPSSANGNSMTPVPASESSGWLLWVLGGVIVAALAGIGVVAATRGRAG